jgi:UDP-N-acetylmuramoyl-L-alanyl-D-glutamate--2,6-diaminopimelate ligase
MAPQSGANLAAGNAGDRTMKAPADSAGNDFSGLASDSREVKPGYLFAALPPVPGLPDGAGYIEDAVRRGAVAVLALPQWRKRVENLNVRFIADANPRLALARAASKFYSVQPKTIAAVTGSNGKTSVAVFLRQIWEQLGHRAASMGTTGIIAPGKTIKLANTTPNAIEFHRRLAELARDGVDRVAMEASSHGLAEYRLNGAAIAAAAFTNITRDHFDYHQSFENYLATKLLLFSEVVRSGGVVVINSDAEHADDFLRAAQSRGLSILTVGETGETVKLIAHATSENGQTLRVAHAGKSYDIALPLAGSFQASNALVAASLTIGLGDPAEKVFASLATLVGAPGRLEKVAYAASGAPVYVDYAHTDDALATVLTAIRPHTKGKLHVIFGCGGDRDTGKRPLMGAAAAKFADAVIVTDDNPRSEDPAAIRKQALAGCPGAREIGDRAEAIRAGIASLAAGDVLVIAGKGHETGQTVGKEVRPFSDRDEAVKAAIALGGRAA